jgi:hypothetical protein
MVDSRVPLKDPRIAGVLAWLIPGAGHFYQGRHFKGAIYSVCILGLFLSGWAMADWSALQPPDLSSRGAFLSNKTLLLKYTAQLGVGLPSICSLVQSRRHFSDENLRSRTIEGPIEAEFTGQFLRDQFPHRVYHDLGGLFRDLDFSQVEVEESRWPLDAAVPVTGRITLKPVRTDLGAETISAEFEGSIDGVPTALVLDPAVLEEPIRSGSQRRVFAVARDPNSPDKAKLGILVASIPRTWLDRAGVPMSPREENQLHGRFGNELEIWMVFTWIAGLLNMLAIWDAVGGPAYAYGDETAGDPEPGPDAPPVGGTAPALEGGRS